ncbi:MAG: DUF4091 domain-containing protein [Planctomycetes bacterium]|nr:DUF4091 domain-containing protein [Planctomycetota bacterium]
MNAYPRCCPEKRSAALAVLLFSFLLSALAWPVRASDGKPPTLHPASAMVRIGGIGGTLPKAAKAWTMDMVRGESEGLQCAIVPGDGEALPVDRVNLTARDAEGPAVRLYRVVAVEHAAPPTEGMFIVPPRRLGQIPDVLMPLEGRAAAAQANPFKEGVAPLTYYIEFHAAAECKPGEFTYALEFETLRGKAELKIKIRVHAVTLPARLPFRTAVCWNWSLKDYYCHALTPEEKKVFWNFCLDYRLSPNAFFGKEPDPAPAELVDLGKRGLSLVCLMQVSGRTPRLLTEKQKEQFGPLLKQWRAELEKQNLVNAAVVLLADEPKAGSEEICQANAKWLKEQFPELKVWLATRPSKAWSESVDVFDVVTASSTDLYKAHSHDDPALAWWRTERPFPKGEYWLFHSVEPYAPYANVRLDNLPIEARVSGWQCAAIGADGYEYFWIADWSGNLEGKETAWPERAKQWKTGLSGAGTLCYPDEKMRPLPSLRLVNLRDGFEDWALLEQLLPRAEHADRRTWIEPVSKSLQEFSTDPEALLKARKRVIEQLEKRARRP